MLLNWAVNCDSRGTGVGERKIRGLVAAFASLFLVGEHVGSQQLVLARLRGMGVVEM